MNKLKFNKSSVLAFLSVFFVLGILFLNFGKFLNTQAATTINKSVTIDTPELSCGEQETQFSGTLVLKGDGWGTGSDWLVVKLDGNPILELNVNDTMTTWLSNSVLVTVGSHTLTAVDYDSAPSNNEQATATPVNFEVGECQVEESPSPTPFDACSNIDGIQYSVPEGMHINATGHECVNFGQPGVEQPSSSSAPEPQVLGATTMADTGNFNEIAYQAIMVIGGTLSAFGIKNLKKASKKV